MRVFMGKLLVLKLIILTGLINLLAAFHLGDRCKNIQNVNHNNTIITEKKFGQKPTRENNFNIFLGGRGGSLTPISLPVSFWGFISPLSGLLCIQFN